MTALIVIGSILLLVFFLLMSSVKVRVISNGDVILKAGAGPFMFTLIPKKNRRRKVKGLSQKKYLSLLSKAKAEKDRGEAEKISHKIGQQDKDVKGSFTHTISFILKVVDRLDIYTSRLKTYLNKLKVTVGGTDAASTAVAYGLVSQTTAYLVEILECKTNLHKAKKDSVTVNCDFTREGISFVVDITVKLRIFDALRTGVDVVLLKLKHDSEKINNNITRKAGNNNGRQ